MIRGVYIAATGMLAESQRQDVIANNLANATTTGFRRSVATSAPFAETLIGNMRAQGAPAVGPLTRGAQLEGVTMLDTQGPVRSTGNPLDVALVGDGYFGVDTAAGRRYTRDGSFSIAPDGRLVTKDGNAVAGVGGAIRLERGTRWTSPPTAPSPRRPVAGGCSSRACARVGHLRGRCPHDGRRRGPTARGCVRGTSRRAR